MTVERTTQQVYWPAPTQGMVSESTYVQGPVQYARFLRNYIVLPGSIRNRRVQNISRVLSDVSGENVIWFNPDDDSYLWSDGVIRNSAGATVWGSATVTSYPPYEGTFLNQTFISYPGEATIQNNNGTWGAFAYTLATLTSSEIAGSVGYKGKAFFWGTDATDGEEYIEYGSLRGVTGNTTSYGVSAFLQKDEIILFCQVPTIFTGIETDQMFVVFGSLGSVLVYVGSDPSSWELTGRYIVSKPLGMHCHTLVHGDVIVMAEDYAYSLRDLFAAGPQAIHENAITSAVQTTYDSFVYYIKSPGADFVPFVHYLRDHDAIVLCGNKANELIPCDEETGLISTYRRIQMVFFRGAGGAMSIWDIPQLSWPVRWYEGGERTEWIYNRTVFKYGDDFPDHLTTDTIAESSHTGDLSAAGAQIETYSSLDHGFSPVELTWGAPVVVANPFLNASGMAVQPFLLQETGARISSAGFFGEGTDQKNLGSVRTHERDGEATSVISASEVYDSVSQPYYSWANRLRRPFINVGLQAYFLSPFVRINQAQIMLEADYETFPKMTNTSNIEVFGMNAFYEPGGPF